MGRADNRRTPKSLRRKAQRRKKMRLKKKIAGGKSKTTESKKPKVKASGATAVAKAPTKRTSAPKEKEVTA